MAYTIDSLLLFFLSQAFLMQGAVYTVRAQRVIVRHQLLKCKQQLGQLTVRAQRVIVRQPTAEM